MPPNDNSPTSCVLVLIMTIDVVVVVCWTCPLWGIYIPPFTLGGEVIMKVTELVTI
jgi:hypothetical protein